MHIIIAGITCCLKSPQFLTLGTHVDIALQNTCMPYKLSVQNVQGSPRKFYHQKYLQWPRSFYVASQSFLENSNYVKPYNLFILSNEKNQFRKKKLHSAPAGFERYTSSNFPQTTQTLSSHPSLAPQTARPHCCYI